MSTESDDEFHERFEAVKPFQGELCVTDFRLMRNLGQGSFATVYEAKPLSSTDADTLGQRVALKMMSTADLERRRHRQQTEMEVRLLSAARSPFLVALLASFQDEEELCIVLELHLGTVFRFLRRKIYFGETAARFLVSQVLLGLEYLHEHRIIYRDLKPENLLVSKEWRLRLCDFSFSKRLSPEAGGRTYTCQGTLEYMAPELVNNSGAHGLAVDWWAFGVLLFELCAGHTPFVAEYQLRLMRRITQAKFKFPEHFSEELRDLVRSLIKVDVTKRLGCLRLGSTDVKTHPWFENEGDWSISLQYWITNSSSLHLPRELRDIDQSESDPGDRLV